MNSKMHIGVVLLFTALLTSFIFAGVLYTPLLRMMVGKFLLANNNREEIPKANQLANAFTPIAPSTPASTPLKTIIGTSTQDAVSSDSQNTTYEYKLVRSVDGCKLNTLGAQGFQAIQYGPSGVNPEAGRDGDCKGFHLVDSFDWILFMRTK
jgi:hypothetical protein